METAILILEYLKVIFSAPVMAAAVIALFLMSFREDLKALLLRVAKIRLPGGTEFSTPQRQRQEAETDAERKPTPEPVAPLLGLPEGLTQEQRVAVENMLRAERATTYVWEYRYLNYFLVYHTQKVLNWLAELPQPVTCRLYDSHWLPLIPSGNERIAIINALETHHLVQVHDELITVTPKGREYIDWRGTIPEQPLTNSLSGSH